MRKKAVNSLCCTKNTLMLVLSEASTVKIKIRNPRLSDCRDSKSIIQIYSGITRGRVLNDELYTQGL